MEYEKLPTAYFEGFLPDVNPDEKVTVCFFIKPNGGDTPLPTSAEELLQTPQGQVIGEFFKPSTPGWEVEDKFSVEIEETDNSVTITTTETITEYPESETNDRGQKPTATAVLFDNGDTPFAAIFLERVKGKEDGAVGLLTDLAEMRANLKTVYQQDFSILITPNWFSGGSQNQTVGSGGPGKVELDDSAGGSTNLPDPDRLAFHWIQEPGGTVSQLVDVYILDTLPAGTRDYINDISSLENASARAVTNSVFTNQKHLLGMLQERIKNHTLTLHSAEEMNITIPSHETCIAGHVGHIEDHGLFIAGIIHSIAPEATLHIIQMLNQNGVGTMRGLSEALSRAVKMQGNNAMVINLSIDFHAEEAIHEAITNLFVEEHEANTLTSGKKPNRAERAKLENKLKAIQQEIQVDIQEFYDAIDLLASVGRATGQGGPGIHLVAAAGNDHQSTSDYPANSISIYGVGAVERWDVNYQTTVANYSNNADAIPGERVWAVGGSWLNPANASDGGLLGASLRSPDGYAWWAGTSFATAITSGALSYVCLRGGDSNYLRTLINDSPVTIAGSGEHVLAITQGPDLPA